MRAIDFATDHVFAGRYRVIRRIAAGGMGAVFEVLHVETNRRRALKVMLPELVTSADLRDRFQRESRVTAGVESEHIVEVFDAGVDFESGMPFLVMELLNGRELEELVAQRGALGPEEVVIYLRQVANALDRTHAANIVHRDLKPANLFLTRRDDGSPRVKILDFGISKVVSDAATGVKSTQALGTPLYMAPEQLTGETLRAQTDLYALGLIAYTLLTGVPYWQEDADRADNMVAFAVLISNGPVEPASIRSVKQRSPLPFAFDAWFAKATHKDPAQRFQKASEQVDALALALRVSTSDRAARIPSGPVLIVDRTVPLGGAHLAGLAADPSTAGLEAGEAAQTSPDPAGLTALSAVGAHTTLDGAVDASRTGESAAPKPSRPLPLLVAGVFGLLLVVGAVAMAVMFGGGSASGAAPIPASAELPVATLPATAPAASNSGSPEVAPVPSTPQAEASAPTSTPDFKRPLAAARVGAAAGGGTVVPRVPVAPATPTPPAAGPGPTPPVAPTPLPPIPEPAKTPVKAKYSRD